MKVLLAHECFLPDFRGGGEKTLYEAARRLLQAGVDLRVVTTGDPRIASYDGIPTLRLPIPRYRMNLAVASLVRAARDVDLIHACNYHAALPALVAGRYLGKPVVCSVLALFGSAWLQMKGPLAGRAYMAWEKQLMHAAFDRTVFASGHSRDLAIELGARPERARVNCPGIEVETYGPAAEKRDLVLFAGKFERRKGVYDLLAAARALPGIRFQMAGWGPEEEGLRRERPENVEILNVTSAQDGGSALRELYANARIFVFPSHAETFGLVLLEAMASGCAIATSIPFDCEGLRFAPHDVPGLVAAISRLWEDRASAAAMGRANLERVQCYTWDRHAARLLEIYSEVLNEAQQRRLP